MLLKIFDFLKSCYEDTPVNILPDIKLQLFLIGVKSLMPYEDNIGCMFDVSRYEKEIELFKYYKNGHDYNLEYYYENKKASEREDELLEFKIIPLIISNTQWDVLVDEAIKNSLFYSVNSNNILNTIIIASVISEFLGNENYIDNLNELTKERVINFSLKNFLINNNIALNKSSLIEFEKERIKLLSKSELITEDLTTKFKSLNYIINETKEKLEIERETVLSSFASYIFKLRKGIINPEKLKIPHGTIPHIKIFVKNDVFNHPLLGRCKVLQRKENVVIIRNKSGLIKVNIWKYCL